ncbi:MAG: 4Fe-4S dicluster domain-containing protein [Ignavibacteriae bacterium]|nr:MAG: 4Fe-4S dicluster domain-containing protein [Ignavibacteriota bacterium]
MSYKITEECISCNACVEECPNDAIYEGGSNWTLGDQTFGEGEAPEGFQAAFSSDYYYVVPGKCTECKGFYDEPQCVGVCPVDCCVPDENYTEDEAALLSKKDYLDQVGR